MNFLRAEPVGRLSYRTSKGFEEGALAVGVFQNIVENSIYGSAEFAFVCDKSEGKQIIF